MFPFKKQRKRKKAKQVHKADIFDPYLCTEKQHPSNDE